MIYIGLARPYNLPWMNRLEIYNEYMILSSCYFMFIYSDGLIWIANPDPKEDEAISDTELMFQCGWYNLGILGFIVFLNLVIMLRMQFKTI